MRGSAAAVSAFLVLVCSCTVEAANVCRSSLRSGPTFAAFLLLISNYKVWATDECSSGTRRPSVKPHSPDQLEISWEGVFQNCSHDHKVTITVVEVGNEEYSTTLSEQKIVVQRDPCHQYKIVVKVVRVDQTISSALANNYNHLEVDPDEMFGGLLKQELSKSCPTQSQPLKIPPALKKCIINHSWTQQNPSFLSVTIWHHKHPEFVEQQIQLNITLDDCSTHDSFPIKHIISAIAIAVFAVLVLVVLGIIVCKKCGERNNEKDAPKETSEMNDMYGQYEFDEEDGTVVRLGSVWVKDKSPQYGETEQAQLSRQFSQVQVKDNNEYYS